MKDEILRQILLNQLAIMRQVSVYYKDSSFVKEMIAQTAYLLNHDPGLLQGEQSEPD
jgi:hypothetical protein